MNLLKSDDKKSRFYLFHKIKNGIKVRVSNYISQRINRRRLIRTDFSIISNNCWGGLISQKYGLKYLSPTCGLLILGHDYIKFCANIKHYLKQELLFFPFSESKYFEMYKDYDFPVAMCDDIEIYFMHYATEKEAAEKWYRRAERINWDFIVYKLSEREAFTKQDMLDFSALPIENKIIIGEEKYSEDTIVIEGIHSYCGGEEDIIAEVFDEAKYFNSIAIRIADN